jgi:hypothetical protein
MNLNSIRPKRAMLHSVAFAAFMVAGTAFAVTPALAAWDSIAVDDDVNTKGGDAGYGVGNGDTKAAAEAEAIKNRKSEGNSGCKIEISYQNTCGAYASSQKHAGHATGANKAAASKAAMTACGEGSCKVVVADCVGQD